MSDGSSGRLVIPADDAVMVEDPAQRVARLTTLLQDLQAHTDSLFELAKEGGGRGVGRSDANRVGSARKRR